MSEKETLNLGDEVSKRNLQKIDPFFQGLVAEVFNRYMIYVTTNACARNNVRLLRWSPDEKERIGELIRTLVVKDGMCPCHCPRGWPYS